MKIIKEVTKEIKFPKHFEIGDPYYLKELQDDKSPIRHIIHKVVYISKHRRKPSWKCEFRVREIEDTDYKSRFIIYDIFLAKYSDSLEVYREGKRYFAEDETSTKIGVDSAEYLIKVDRQRTITFDIGHDGVMGCVNEYTINDNLNGIIINMRAGQRMDFEDVVSKLSYLFEVVES